MLHVPEVACESHVRNPVSATNIVILCEIVSTATIITTQLIIDKRFESGAPVAVLTIVVRPQLLDKLIRAYNLTLLKDEPALDNESTVDAWEDLTGYSSMGTSLVENARNNE